MRMQRKKRAIFLKGRATVLRPLSEETDLKDITRWINDPAVRRNLRATFPGMEAGESKWIRGVAERMEQMKEIVLAVETLDGAFIGTIGLHNINWQDRTATTGMLIGEAACRRKGYGTDAKMALLDYAFNTLGLRKICSSALAFNIGSKKCLEKCGYRYEGRRRKQVFKDGAYHDEFLYACYQRGWLAARKVWLKKPAIHDRHKRR